MLVPVLARRVRPRADQVPWTRGDLHGALGRDGGAWRHPADPQVPRAQLPRWTIHASQRARLAFGVEPPCVVWPRLGRRSTGLLLRWWYQDLARYSEAEGEGGWRGEG